MTKTLYYLITDSGESVLSVELLRPSIVRSDLQWAVPYTNHPDEASIATVWREFFVVLNFHHETLKVYFHYQALKAYFHYQALKAYFQYIRP